MTPPAAAAGVAAADGSDIEAKRTRAPNELEMARQYSETSARVSQALERKADGGKAKDGPVDLKKEVEMWEHKVSVEEMVTRLKTDAENGLTDAEAKLRLERDGPNVLSPPKVTPWYVKLLLQFVNFFAILLQVAAILCFIGFGLHPESKDNLYLGIILYVVVIVTALFTFAQEFKSEKTMEKFANFLPPQTVVHRGGKVLEVPARDLVVGDLCDVKLGDKIPADLRIVSNQKLKVDNSPLTGESEPIGRTVDCTDENPLETKNLAFFGTLAVDGTAQGVVVNTGDDTVFGRIAGLAAGSSSETTTLQKDIHHFVIIISAVAIFLGIAFFIIGVAKDTDIISNIVFCIGIIVANVPEGLLATVTVSLTLSAQRMSKKQVLVKKLEAVETMGSTTCICSDKTGTLTQNRMTIVHLVYDLELHTTKGAATEATFNSDNACYKDLFYIACNCGKATFDSKEMDDFPDRSIDERKVNGDASEAGILKFCEKIESVETYRKANPQVSGIPFNSTNKFMITINEDSVAAAAGVPDRLRMCVKGAPERVVDKCSNALTSAGVVPMSAEIRAKINEHLAFMMERGERVLGFAQLPLDASFTRDFEFDTEDPNFPMEGFTFVGLMALLDPPREAVPGAVATCQSAGIKVVMVTGDHPATAKSIAKQVNIIRDPTAEDVARERGIPVEEVDRSEIKSIVVPGSQIKDLDEADWDRVLAHDQIVFARTSPQQKLIIVENNQRLNHIVAVTGDGVNDSPALKKANIGVAMGISGSDVSKEAADMILLDDNFASIVAGVEEGRLIFDNLKKSIAYTLTSNIPEITPFLTFILVGVPLPLTTFLILCIDLGTDLLPAISLAYEEAEADIMRRPPRDAQVDRLVNRRLISFSYFQIGVIQALAGFFTYLVVFNDYGLSAGTLIGLDTDTTFSTQQSDDMRWLFVERVRPRGRSFDADWFRTENGDFDTFFRANRGFNPEFQLVSPQLPSGAAPATLGAATDRAGREYNAMFQQIGRLTGRTSCRESTCALGNNNPACFAATGVVTDLGINTGVENSDVIEGDDAGQGCFDLWTREEQDEIIKRAQTSFLVSIVVVQIGGILVCKTRVLSLFTQGVKNKVLIAGVIQEIVLIALLVYVPWLHDVFGTRPLRVVHLLPAIPFAIFIIFYDELRKFFIRKGDRTGNKLGKWLRYNTYW
uniref:Na+-ATPase n=1 Tax=Pyropia yezoensis TaxID=2788 RepID=I4DSP4_PYRYE|nr:Na+-ATPase [Neopyropia yezoensis]